MMRLEETQNRIGGSIAAEDLLPKDAIEIDQIRNIFELQKANYRTQRDVSFETRRDRIRRVESLFRDNYETMITALQADFGTRDRDVAFLGDIVAPLMHTADVLKHLRSWMKPQKRRDGFLGLLGQRSILRYEPLGVVGIISPFNAPITLAFDPAIDAFAAGNTVMLRFPELMPRVGELMHDLVPKYFDKSELAIVTGDIEVSKFFASLPWDKLVFTGGSATAKHIMAAAAKNLTPVLLELGGKSPVVVLEDADLERVAQKTAKIRLMNGGQVCIAGDYALVQETKVDAFVKAVVRAAEAAYPTILDNPRYTSIVGDASFDRLTAYVDEAEQRGTRVVTVNPAEEGVPDRASRKFPLTIVVDPPEDIRLSREEIFGPILPIVSYKTIEDAVEIINRKEKPLALYVFGSDAKQIDYVLTNTSSGGVTVNDFLLHAGSHDMGFGGVGNSGMGRYKGGRIGFEAFSNPKSVLYQGLLARFTTDMFVPFGSDRARKMVSSAVGLDFTPSPALLSNE